MKGTLAAAAGSVIVTLSCAAGAAAPVERYPEKPIRFIVPFPPGALNDLLGRMLAQKIGDAWGHQVVVDNRAGGNTIIGTEMAAKSPPDGYTLLLCSFALAINSSLYAKLPYDASKDFAFVTLIASTPYLLIVQPALPAKSVAELVALAKAKPGQLNYGSTGNGGTSNIMGEMLKTMAGIDIVHIPYKGLTPALNDLFGGQINMAFGSYSTVGQHWKAGRLRALAVTSATRSPYTPEVPTIAESGYPGYEVNPWWGIAVAAGTPKPLIAKLNAELIRIMQLPDVKDKMQVQGIEIVTSTPERFAAHFRSESARLGKVVRDTRIRAE